MIKMDNADDPRYVLISPLCSVVEVLVAVICRRARPSGPVFFNHEESIKWLAIFCPVFNRKEEVGRCIRWLKYPSVREKFE